MEKTQEVRARARTFSLSLSLNETRTRDERKRKQNAHHRLHRFRRRSFDRRRGVRHLERLLRGLDRIGDRRRRNFFLLLVDAAVFFFRLDDGFQRGRSSLRGRGRGELEGRRAGAGLL